MAFRASTKSKVSAKPKAEKIVPEKPEEPIVAPPISIEDIVGGPKEQVKPEMQHVAEPMPKQDRPPAPPPPRQGFDRGRNGYGGGFRRPMNNGYQTRFGSEPGRQGFTRPTSYRREWTPRPQSETFTQDVDVPTETVHGILDIMPEGHGFLRPKFTPSDRDVYISQSQIRRFLLRNGDMVEGQARAPKDNERYWGLLKVEKVDDKPAEEMENRPKFDDLTPLYPNKQLKLETCVWMP